MSPEPAVPPTPWRGRLVVLAGVVLVSLNLRVAVAAVSPVLDSVRADVALSATDAGVLGAAPVLAFALFGALAPAAGRRWGLEPALVAAMLLSALGEVARAAATTPVVFLLFSFVALAGMGMGNVLVPPLVRRSVAGPWSGSWRRCPGWSSWCARRLRGVGSGRCSSTS
jgi:CP family cyanate transporter-like MFS transporter